MDHYGYYKPNNYNGKGSNKGQLSQWDVQAS